MKKKLRVVLRVSNHGVERKEARELVFQYMIDHTDAITRNNEHFQYDCTRIGFSKDYSEIHITPSVTLRWDYNNGHYADEYEVFLNGKVIYYGLWDDLLGQDDESKSLRQSRNGIEMVITSNETGKIVYRGGFSADLKSREGFGYQYRRIDGTLFRCGYFINDNCIAVYQSFSGDKMIEYSMSSCECNGPRQIIYMGEYKYQEESDVYVYNGKGRQFSMTVDADYWYKNENEIPTKVFPKMKRMKAGKQLRGQALIRSALEEIVKNNVLGGRVSL